MVALIVSLFSIGAGHSAEAHEPGDVASEPSREPDWTEWRRYRDRERVLIGAVATSGVGVGLGLLAGAALLAANSWDDPAFRAGSGLLGTGIVVLNEAAPRQGVGRSPTNCREAASFNEPATGRSLDAAATFNRWLEAPLAPVPSATRRSPCIARAPPTLIVGPEDTAPGKPVLSAPAALGIARLRAYSGQQGRRHLRT